MLWTGATSSPLLVAADNEAFVHLGASVDWSLEGIHSDRPVGGHLVFVCLWCMHTWICSAHAQMALGKANENASHLAGGTRISQKTTMPINRFSVGQRERKREGESQRQGVVRAVMTLFCLCPPSRFCFPVFVFRHLFMCRLFADFFFFLIVFLVVWFLFIFASVFVLYCF